MLHLYHVAAQKEVAQLSGHTDSAFGVDFSPKEHIIVSGSHDKTVRVWDWDKAMREYGLSAEDKAALNAAKRRKEQEEADRRARDVSASRSPRSPRTPRTNSSAASITTETNGEHRHEAFCTLAALIIGL